MQLVQCHTFLMSTHTHTYLRKKNKTKKIAPHSGSSRKSHFCLFSWFHQGLPLHNHMWTLTLIVSTQPLISKDIH